MFGNDLGWMVIHFTALCPVGVFCIVLTSFVKMLHCVVRDVMYYKQVNVHSIKCQVQRLDRSQNLTKV